MSLQDIFYLVSIITMSLIAVLLLALVVVAIYIRIKIGEIADTSSKVLNDAKNIVSNPKLMATSIGEAVVDTAVNQVEKIIKPKSRTKRLR